MFWIVGIIEEKYEYWEMGGYYGRFFGGSVVWIEVFGLVKVEGECFRGGVRVRI